jgi:hypothetical protein
VCVKTRNINICSETSCYTRITKKHLPNILTAALVRLKLQLYTSLQTYKIENTLCTNVGEGLWVPVGARFSSLHVAQLVLGPPSLLCNVYWWPFPLGGGVIKQLRHEADHSPLTSAEVKKKWAYTSTPHKSSCAVLNYLHLGAA